jgi:hypothetical protein
VDCPTTFGIGETMDINIYHHNVALSEINNKLDVIFQMLKSILKKERQMSEQLDTLTGTVVETGSVIDSAITLLDGLSAQIAAIKDDPAAIQALADELTAKKDALAAAIVANTPAA